MSRRLRSPLAKVLQLVERETVASEIEKRVEQHRAVTGTQEEAVAVRPTGILRVVAQEASPEQISQRRAAQRQASVPRLGLLHGVNRERANRVDAKLV